MNKFTCFGKKLRHLCSCSCLKLFCLTKSSQPLLAWFYQFILFRVNPFWIQLSYFISISFLGFLFLRVLKPKHVSFRPRNLDLFFMSVSSGTVSSMSTVEMEVFSNSQLVVILFLMFIGGEVFTSFLGLVFEKSKLVKPSDRSVEMAIVSSSSIFDNVKPRLESDSEDYLRYNSVRYLRYIILGYLLGVVLVGSSMVMVYVSMVSNATNVLKSKRLNLVTFSIFTVVSTFTNCGFVPTNENMIVFKNNPGLLLILLPQILLGNTLFASCLRGVIWVLNKLKKKDEYGYMLENTGEIGYFHLFPSLNSMCLVVSVVGFIVVQFVVFCCMEWNGEALDGLNSYEKFVDALFVTVNSRHAGESVVDLSILSSAVLVLFVFMMYLPPYTTFLPIKQDEEEDASGSYGKRKKKKKQRGGQLVESLLLSQLSYLVIFTILICITERKKLKDDPLNFNVLNIVIEVVSAYGNVGFSTGYSCKRRLHPEGEYCRDAWYGFSGRWGDEGKMILMLVMFFGRLKKFNINGGKAWKIS